MIIYQIFRKLYPIGRATRILCYTSVFLQMIATTNARILVWYVKLRALLKLYKTFFCWLLMFWFDYIVPLMRYGFKCVAFFITIQTHLLLPILFLQSIYAFLGRPHFLRVLSKNIIESLTLTFVILLDTQNMLSRYTRQCQVSDVALIF